MGNGVSAPAKTVRDRGMSNIEHQTSGLTKQNMSKIARLAEAKSKFMNTSGRKEARRCSKRIHGSNFIKELYHRLDPNIALPNATDITGEVQVALKYSSEEKLLLVKIIQARELVPRDIVGYSDPYAVIKVVPDRFNEGTKKTKKKLRTLNPVFQEIFSFAMQDFELLETKICIDLYDHDVVGSDDFMGQAVIDTSNINLSNELTYSEWFMLQNQTDFSVTGAVDVSLYHECSSLFVTIHKAKDLLHCDFEDCSTLVSVHIPFTHQNRTTKIVEGCISAEFEETFEFDVSADEIPFRSIIMNIYRVTQGEEKPIGNIHINLKRYSTGQRSRNWYRVTDLVKKQGNRNASMKTPLLDHRGSARFLEEKSFHNNLYNTL